MKPEQFKDTMRESAEVALEIMVRDQFAMQALCGMLSRPNSSPSCDIPKGASHKSAMHYAAAAYEFADAMMEARKQ